MQILITLSLFCTLSVIFATQVNGLLQIEELGVGSRKCELKHADGSEEFPIDFGFGVSTAAFQIEGGWNEDGKGPSIWDTFTHEHPEMIDDHETADVGADSYHRFDQDLVALKQLKVKFYRFSIAWTRLFPNGDISSRNQKGIDYYNMIIDKLVANGIEPVVTMVHYDIPENFNEFGGFTNELMVRYFVSYADALFSLYGDRVKTWITFNEPFDYCMPGYADGNYPPMIKAPGVLDYLCLDTTLRAHASAYRHYRRRYFKKQQGKVGLVLSSRFYYTKTNNTELVNRAMQYSLGWLGHPLYSEEGGYSAEIKQDIDRNSALEGRSFSRLRPLSARYKNLIKGAADFLGLNYYTSRYVESTLPSKADEPSYAYDSCMKYPIDPTWSRGKSTWLYCVPEGLEDILKWIRDNYNNIEVIVTENGYSDDGELQDSGRIAYLKAHLQAVLNAVNSGCNVSGYSHWSLIDNFEWQRGYTEKFGLYYVNLTSPNKDRIAKDSALYYQSVISSRRLNNNKL